eukprot:s59_g27.t1
MASRSQTGRLAEVVASQLRSFVLMNAARDVWEVPDVGRISLDHFSNTVQVGPRIHMAQYVAKEIRISHLGEKERALALAEADVLRRLSHANIVRSSDK